MKPRNHVAIQAKTRGGAGAHRKTSKQTRCADKVAYRKEARAVSKANSDNWPFSWVLA
ncbi:MAG TPA: hypothetical protein VFV28_06260 [Limnobacter sp.]|nr:hypothetical protein [Limnobacter sp.]